MSFYFLFSGLVQKLFQFALHPSFREETYHTPPPLLPKSAYYIPEGFDKIYIHISSKSGKLAFKVLQCWTEGRSSTAVAEDLRPTAERLKCVTQIKSD